MSRSRVTWDVVAGLFSLMFILFATSQNTLQEFYCSIHMGRRLGKKSKKSGHEFLWIYLLWIYRIYPDL